MNYRRLGKTGLLVSEIGFGGEWMERHTPEECKAVLEEAAQSGINILDCWMSEPNVRSSLGNALKAVKNGTYRAISVPPGRTANMYAPET